MKDSHVVVLPLHSLPESYGPLIDDLETRPEADRMLECVMGKIMGDYNYRKELQTGKDTEISEAALKVDEQTAHRRENRVFYSWEKTGHLKKPCSICKSKQRTQISDIPKAKAKAAADDSADEVWHYSNALPQRIMWLVHRFKGNKPYDGRSGNSS